MTRTTTGYDTKIVLAFIDAHMDAGALNGVRLIGSEKEKIDRWVAKPVVPMARVDALLLKHGLMLFELEQWGLEHYGDTGFRSADLLPYY